MNRQIEIINIPAFLTNWKRVQRKALKLGLPAPVAKPIGEPYFRECKETVSSGAWFEADVNYVYSVEVQLFEVEVVPVSFDGWSVVGLLEPLQGKDNLLVPCNEHSAKWASAASRHYCTGQICEHCNTSRRRAKLFVVGRDDDPTVTRQVGSSCLADFCPSSSGSAAAAFEFQEHTYRLLKEHDFGCERQHAGTASLKPLTILEAACEACRAAGYTSRKKAEESGTYSTTDRVKLAFSKNADRKQRIAPGEKAIATAATILEWSRAEAVAKSAEAYWNGVGQFLRLDIVPLHRLGYIVGLVGAYDAHQRQLERERGAEASEWQGAVGERRDFTGTITRVSTFDGTYGVGWITILRTPEGHVLKYWNRIGEVGETYQFSAGIKGHELDNFSKARVTVLSRCTKIKAVESVTA